MAKLLYFIYNMKNYLLSNAIPRTYCSHL